LPWLAEFAKLNVGSTNPFDLARGHVPFKALFWGEAMKTNRRPALTLMELLVVIAIIAVIAAMLIPAVMRVPWAGPELKREAEITKLDSALRRFQTTYTIYPPSQIRLCEKYSDYDSKGSLLDARSLTVLQKMFPRLESPNHPWKTGAMTIDWDGDGAVSAPVVLTGDQCLVFFLGGIPNPLGGTRGFGTGLNPAAPPFSSSVSFDAKRLAKVRGNNFPSFLDPYEKRPYAYFSSEGGYNSWVNLAGAYTCDCPDLPGGAMGGTDVWPYMTAPNTFHNPTSFQIVSAGRDGLFGPGNVVLTPGTGVSLPAAAQDDGTNFTTKMLRGY
jgi:hypothetical protein